MLLSPAPMRGIRTTLKVGLMSLLLKPANATRTWQVVYEYRPTLRLVT